MATHTLTAPYYVGSSLNAACPRFAGGPEETYFKEVASAAWVAGDLIYVDSNGKMAECTDSSGKLNSAIAGQALTAATGVTDTQVFFRVIRPDDIYAMNVYHATVGSAVTNQNQLTDIFGVFTSAAGLWHVDIENTTTEDGTTALAKVQVIGFPDKHPVTGVTNTIGDTYGIVYVKFLPFTIATDGSPMTRNLQLA